MAHQIKIALLQTSLFWENPTQNRLHLEEKINAISEAVDLIVLPEMFTSGFTMHPKNIAETMNGTTILWLIALAKAKNCAITGSLVITENGKYYNRLVFVYPDGKLEFYNKKHLFSLANEDQVYTAGNEKRIVNYKGFKICLLICYDLRFPVFSRNIEKYDALIYVANWPKARIHAWNVLLKARAIENMCYVVGTNRIGQDENQLEYNGHSQVVDYLGNTILEPQETEGVFRVTLDRDKMLKTREKYNFLADGDDFELKTT
jgi:omega-amidase